MLVRDHKASKRSYQDSTTGNLTAETVGLTTKPQAVCAHACTRTKGGKTRSLAHPEYTDMGGGEWKRERSRISNKKAQAPVINVYTGTYRERSHEEVDTVAQPMCALGGYNNKVNFTLV